MPLTTRTRSIPERLRDTFPPVESFDGSIANALRAIADRLEVAAASRTTIVRQARRNGMSPDECLAIIETIAMVAAMDDVTITAATSSVSEGGMEVRFTLLGEQAVVDGLATMISGSDGR